MKANGRRAAFVGRPPAEFAGRPSRAKLLNTHGGVVVELSGRPLPSRGSPWASIDRSQLTAALRGRIRMAERPRIDRGLASRTLHSLHA